MDPYSHLLGERSERLFESNIKEMIEEVHKTGSLSFTAGEPSEDLIPMEKIKQALWDSFDSGADLFCYYHDPSGLEKLREWIIDWMGSDGLLSHGIDFENVILTSGSQEGLNLVAESVIDRGDVVVTEDPSYPEAFLTFTKEGAELESINLDSQGPSAEELERIAEKKKIKFFYTIPCFQNPTGATTSLSRRKEILALARRYHFLVIEDDPYRQLWFNEPPPNSYLSLPDNDGRVIYLGSFSKLIAPGVRCGWIIAPEWILKTFIRLRVASHLNLPTIIQQGVLNFIGNNYFNSHIAFLRKTYASRRDALVQSLKRHIPEKVLSFGVPQGGFFLWGEVPLLEDARSFALFAVREEKVGILDGRTFSCKLKPFERGKIRLSFAKVSPEEAEEGCQRLARAFLKYGVVE